MNRRPDSSLTQWIGSKGGFYRAERTKKVISFPLSEPAASGERRRCRQWMVHNKPMGDATTQAFQLLSEHFLGSLVANFRRGQRLYAISLSMSVYHVLLGQCGAIEITVLLSCSGADKTEFALEGRCKLDQRIIKATVATARESLVLATDSLWLNLEPRRSTSKIPHFWHVKLKKSG